MKIKLSPELSKPKNHLFLQRPVYAGLFFIISILAAAPAAFRGQSKPASKAGTVSAMEKEMSAVYRPDLPGAAVIVVKNGRVIFRRGYWLANLELKVPVKPEMVFRLCSVTKQFTAAAIMMLVEQGNLSLNDDITKFFPGYPAAGKKITVENLLTHTSGIKDYLDKVWTAEKIARNFSPEELIDLFKTTG